MIVESPVLSRIPGIRHGFGTREGGVSKGIYESLNCGTGSKDDPVLVAENRSRLARIIGAVPNQLVTPYQVHSATAVIVDHPWERTRAPKADAVVTRQPEIAIAVSTADCVPVLFADAQAGIVGAAHAGWRGALSGVLDAALDAMETLGGSRGRITASIGPAISQKAYEVGAEFEAVFLEANPENALFFNRKSPESKPHFDLTGFAAHRLRRAGVGTIENLQCCTYYDSQRFFSYRRTCHRSEPDYGRQISAIVISR